MVINPFNRQLFFFKIVFIFHFIQLSSFNFSLSIFINAGMLLFGWYSVLIFALIKLTTS